MIKICSYSHIGFNVKNMEKMLEFLLQQAGYEGKVYADNGRYPGVFLLLRRFEGLPGNVSILRVPAFGDPGGESGRYMGDNY